MNLDGIRLEEVRYATRLNDLESYDKLLFPFLRFKKARSVLENPIMLTKHHSSSIFTEGQS